MKKISYSLFALVLFTACQKEAKEAQNTLDQTNEISIEDGRLRAGRPLTAMLSGANEVPGPGDPDGTGTAEIYLNYGQGTITYKLTVTNIAPATLAHIHVGAAGVAGPPVVTLTEPNDGSSEGTLSVERELIKKIMQNPENYYVNIHNAQFRPGAVRGQLSK